jgi:Domain of unknown function (DUF5127)
VKEISMPILKRIRVIKKIQEGGAFEQTGRLPDSDDFSERASARRGIQDVIAASLNLGSVGAAPVQRYLMLAYDDIWAIKYFERRERAWWRRNGNEAADLIRRARREHDLLMRKGAAFDEELMADMKRIGGEEYARLGSVAYRQTLAAHKLIADVDGAPMFLPKENFIPASNLISKPVSECSFGNGSHWRKGPACTLAARAAFSPALAPLASKV